MHTINKQLFTHKKFKVMKTNKFNREAIIRNAMNNAINEKNVEFCKNVKNHKNVMRAIRMLCRENWLTINTVVGIASKSDSAHNKSVACNNVLALDIEELHKRTFNLLQNMVRRASKNGARITFTLDSAKNVIFAMTREEVMSCVNTTWIDPARVMSFVSKKTHVKKSNK